MSITRRQFLLTTAGTSIGFILPSFYEKALGFWENHGEPLILPSSNADETLYASVFDLELHLGDPRQPMPTMTWREFIDTYKFGDYSDYLDPDDESGEMLWVDLEDEADPASVLEYWGDEIPSARAHDLMTELDIGPDLTGENTVGEIRLLSGFPGSDYRGVAAADFVSLSLLQERLNQLNTGIRVEMM